MRRTFVTMENGPWHIHMDSARVRRITFEVKPDIAHNSQQLSYRIRFFGTDGTALLRVHGGNRDVILCGED